MEKRHTQNLQRLMGNMTTRVALQMLQKTANATVMELVEAALKARKISSFKMAQTGNLRASQDPGEKGYSGVDKAKNMLNEMIQETQAKYDIEIQQCCDYDTTAASTRPRTCSMR